MAIKALFKDGFSEAITAEIVHKQTPIVGEIKLSGTGLRSGRITL